MFRLSLRHLILAFALFALATATLLHPPGAYACSCVAPPPAGEARDEAVAVFSGTVSAVDTAASATGLPVLVTFDLLESWKGPNGPQLTIGTSGSSASCGYEFVPGEQYLVYAFLQEGQFGTGLCTRTAPLADAGADLAALGSGAAPAPAEPTPNAAPLEPASPAASLPVLPLALVAVTGAAVAAIALTFRRRAR